VLIRKIELENFMSYDKEVIELPRKGVVVITGSNGSGKSSIAEAPATSVWGKTLRGSSPWVTDKKGVSKVTTEIGGSLVEFTRQATKKGKVSADFSPSPTNYSTVTKTQAAINSLAGDFDTWRKCSVFSSQDAAHFTLATDAERKRLLESLLGLDRFDIALKSCRDETKIITAKIRDIENDLLKIQTEERVKEARLEEVNFKLRKARAKAEVEGVYSEEQLGALEKLTDGQQEKFNQLCADLQTIEAESVGLKMSKEQHTKAVLRLDQDACPTCHQSLNTSGVEKMRADSLSEVERISIRLKEMQAKRTSLNSELTSLERDLRKNNAEINKQRSLINVGERSLIAHLQEVIEDTTNELAELSSRYKKINRSLEDVQYDLALCENTQTVLGTKGVRAHILTSALGALEATSNKWLRKIASKTARIAIKPYVENKSGGIRESISLEISGIGDGQGYKSLSGGQRRRVDVALLLGLSELAQASNQHTKGTVFFDEVFDSLDTDGVSSVSSVIEEMATDRPVIIISHSSSLVDSLSSCTHYVVENGEVRLK